MSVFVGLLYLAAIWGSGIAIGYFICLVLHRGGIQRFTFPGDEHFAQPKKTPDNDAPADLPVDGGGDA